MEGTLRTIVLYSYQDRAPLPDKLINVMTGKGYPRLVTDTHQSRAPQSGAISPNKQVYFVQVVLTRLVHPSLEFHSLAFLSSIVGVLD